MNHSKVIKEGSVIYSFKGLESVFITVYKNRNFNGAFWSKNVNRIYLSLWKKVHEKGLVLLKNIRNIQGEISCLSYSILLGLKWLSVGSCLFKQQSTPLNVPQTKSLNVFVEFVQALWDSLKIPLWNNEIVEKYWNLNQYIIMKF